MRSFIVKRVFLVKEGDVSGMAAYMIRLLDDSDLTASMGKAGRLHVEENYNQALQLQKLFELADASVNQIQQVKIAEPEFSEI